MTPKEIAQVILTVRENRMSSYIMPGELREKLGFEGYSEALRRRWLIADSDVSGMVQVTNILAVVEELRQIAECEPCAPSPGAVKYGTPGTGNPVEYPSGNANDHKMGEEKPKSEDKGEAVKKTFSAGGDGGSPVDYPSGESTEQKMGTESGGSEDKGEAVKKTWSNEAARYTLAHAGRSRTLHEIAPPATGKPAVTFTPARPATTPNATGRPNDAQVGDQVIVASEGQTYTATVARRSPDGTFNLSFGEKGPRDGQRPYKAEEFQVAGVAAPATR